MVNPATQTSISINSPLPVPQRAEPAANPAEPSPDGAKPAGFADVLASAVPITAEAPQDPATSPVAAEAGKRQEGGKPTGKILPDGLPLAVPVAVLAALQSEKTADAKPVVAKPEAEKEEATEAAPPEPASPVVALAIALQSQPVAAKAGTETADSVKTHVAGAPANPVLPDQAAAKQAATQDQAANSDKPHAQDRPGRPVADNAVTLRQEFQATIAAQKANEV